MSRALALLTPRRSRAAEEAPRRPALEIVPAPRRRLGVLGMLVLGVVFVAALALVAFHAVLVQRQLRLDQLDQQVAEEEARYQKLRLAVAEMEAPDRIVAEASRLGLVTPPAVVYLVPEGELPASDRSGRLASNGPTPRPPDWARVKPFLGGGR